MYWSGLIIHMMKWCSIKVYVLYMNVSKDFTRALCYRCGIYSTLCCANQSDGWWWKMERPLMQNPSLLISKRGDNSDSCPCWSSYWNVFLKPCLHVERQSWTSKCCFNLIQFKKHVNISPQVLFHHQKQEQSKLYVWIWSMKVRSHCHTCLFLLNQRVK